MTLGYAQQVRLVGQVLLILGGNLMQLTYRFCLLHVLINNRICSDCIIRSILFICLLYIVSGRSFQSEIGLWLRFVSELYFIPIPIRF